MADVRMSFHSQLASQPLNEEKIIPKRDHVQHNQEIEDPTAREENTTRRASKIFRDRRKQQERAAENTIMRLQQDLSRTNGLLRQIQVEKTAADNTIEKLQAELRTARNQTQQLRADLSAADEIKRLRGE